MHNMDVECEEFASDMYQKGYSQLDRLATLSGDPMDTEGPPLEDPTSRSGMLMDEEEDTGVPHTVESIPNLEVPTVLGIHNLGILTLEAFPGQPKVIVCLQCRFPFSISKLGSFWGHVCREDSHEEEAEGAESEDPSEAGEEPMEVDVEDGEWDREEDEGQEETLPSQKPRRVRPPWAPTFDYLRPRLHEFSKANQLFPTEPIPVIPFFPVTEAFGCPSVQCPVAYKSKRHLEEHMRRHGEFSSQDEAMPSLVQVQTLRVTSNPRYFKVITVHQDLAQISVRQQILEALSSKGTVTDGEDADTVGPQFIDVFYKTFPYHSIFPSNAKERDALVTRLVPSITPIRKNGQSHPQQLLALTCLRYMMKGSHALYGVDNLLQRHLGNKLR